MPLCLRSFFAGLKPYAPTEEQLQVQRQIQGFFASLRMTTEVEKQKAKSKSKDRSRSLRDDKQERQLQRQLQQQ